MKQHKTTLLSQLEEDLAIGVTAYKVKYGNDVSQMVWPAKAQVEEMHAGGNLGLIALYRQKIYLLERLETINRSSAGGLSPVHGR